MKKIENFSFVRKESRIPIKTCRCFLRNVKYFRKNIGMKILNNPQLEYITVSFQEQVSPHVYQSDLQSILVILRKYREII